MTRPWFSPSNYFHFFLHILLMAVVGTDIILTIVSSSLRFSSTVTTTRCLQTYFQRTIANLVISITVVSFFLAEKSLVRPNNEAPRRALGRIYLLAPPQHNGAPWCYYGRQRDAVRIMLLLINRWLDMNFTRNSSDVMLLQWQSRTP